MEVTYIKSVDRKDIRLNYRHMCLVYDGFKDLFKVFANGEKLESGAWTGDGVFEPARFVWILVYHDFNLITGKMEFYILDKSRAR